MSGYNLIKTETTLYHLSYQPKDQQNAIILDATHTLTNDNCSKWSMFALLVEEAMTKADFNHPIDRSYNIDLPDDHVCQ